MKPPVTVLFLAISSLTAAAQQTPKAYRAFAEDVLICSERGTNNFLCRRWPDSPSVSCFRAPEGFESVFDTAVGQINEAMAPSRLELRRLLPNEGTAQIKFYYTTRADYVRIARSYGIQSGDRDYGWFNWWDNNDQLNKSVVLVSTDGLSGADIHYRTLRTLLGALGFWGWTDEPVESVFRHKTRTALTDADRRLIPFFYTHVKSGFERYQLRRAFDQYWTHWRR